MATQKKKGSVVVKKTKSLPASSKKAMPAKKVVAKKSAPVKKKVVAKAASVVKKGRVVKSTPVKKAAAKKPALKKLVAKKPAVKNVQPLKKVVAKKSAPVKNIAKKAKVAASKKSVATKAAPKNTAPKLINSKTKIRKSIIKSSPAKNTAKTGAKKAGPKTLAKPKNTVERKPEPPVKKMAAKKEPIKKIVAPAKAPKPVAKVVEPDTITNHKAEMKKALMKVKAKKQEAKRTEKPFVMPKTNTDKSRKYEPEFTKSVLDQAPEEYSGPTMRYSDNELVEFRELIERKLETAKKELGYLQGLITRKDQMGGDDTDNRYMTMEDGGLSMEREQLSQMASRQITFIDHLEKAMMRIENKTYGICRVTGKLIDKARLRAVPHATLSIEAKMGR